MPSLSNNFNHFKEEVMVRKRQGIVSILGFDSVRTKSLRRTLSADMSPKKWPSQNGFSSRLKKTASFEEFPFSINADSSSSEGEDEYDKDTEPPIQEKREKEDIWSSILTEKAQQETNNLPPPYIHPLVKRSTSSLGEKSLEICTESLGSETGSDGLSSYPPSDTEEDKEEEERQQQQEERIVQNYDVEDRHVATNKSPPKTFPPPLPSLSRHNGASLRMRSSRDNGRLILEAISIPSQNNFKAQRQEGRLVLRFINTSNQEEEEEEEEGIRREEKNEKEKFEVESENSDAEEETEEEEVDEKKVRFTMEQTPKLSSGPINVYRLMNKPMVLANTDLTWANKFNEIVKFEEITPIRQSLPPRQPVARMIPMLQATTAAAATASFNVYEYYWKPKPIASQRI